MAAELRLGNFHTQNATQPFTHIIAGDFDLGFFRQFTVVDIFVDDPCHRGAQTGQVRAPVALRNVVGKAKNLFVISAVPLHRDFHTNIGVLVTLTVARRVEDVWVEYRLSLVDEVDKTPHATRARKIVLLAAAFVFQTDLDAVVQKTQLTQPLAQNFIVKVGIGLKDFQVRKKMHFRTALLGVSDNFHRRDLHPLHLFDDPILYKTPRKFEYVHLPIAAYRQSKHLAQSVHATDTHAVQPARYFVAVLVKFPARVQFRQRYLCGRSFWFMLVVHLDASGNPTAVVDDADGVVGMDGYQNIVAMPRERFIN